MRGALPNECSQSSARSRMVAAWAFIQCLPEWLGGDSPLSRDVQSRAVQHADGRTIRIIVTSVTMALCGRVEVRFGRLLVKRDRALPPVVAHPDGAPRRSELRIATVGEQRLCLSRPT